MSATASNKSPIHYDVEALALVASAMSRISFCSGAGKGCYFDHGRTLAKDLLSILRGERRHAARALAHRCW